MVVCGVDEAGRGPLAGPVTAAAVVLGPGFPVELLADSKAISEKRRERAAAVIKERAAAWAVAWATHLEIDTINILKASLLAMQRAVALLRILPDEVLVDGIHTPLLPCSARPIVGGDAEEPTIMAASILAKTSRDRWMVSYAGLCPGYGFEAHKGYPTEHHKAMLRELGPSEIHRLTFRLT